jgi:hypothetical protein
MLVAHLSLRRCSCRCVRQDQLPDASGVLLGLVLLVSRSLGRGANVSALLVTVNFAAGFSGVSLRPPPAPLRRAGRAR